MWLWLTLISALFLGLYDLARKHALRDNAVLPVLLLATTCGATLILPLLAVSSVAPALLRGTPLYIPPIPAAWHGLLAVKGILVSLSWMLAFFSLKHLPISIVAPIRGSAPVWTVVGAVLIFHEAPAPLQWAGLTLTFVSYYGLSLAGLKEGIAFHRNPWIFCIAGATLLGAVNALYDKYLLQSVGMTPFTMQAWFSCYLVLCQGALVLFFWVPSRNRTTPLRWAWSIPAIGLLLFVSDLVYFRAVHDPQALIAVISPLRRSSMVLSFVLGGILFREKNRRIKALPLAGVAAGLLLAALGG